MSINKMADISKWGVQFPSGEINTANNLILSKIQPPDWSTAYTKYFTSSGTAVTGSSAPTWRANTYYFGPGQWYAIFDPSAELPFEHTNLVGSDTGWSEGGANFISWVQRDIVKVNLRYTRMTASELAYMKNLLQGHEYIFRYYDVYEVCTANSYTGDMQYNKISEAWRNGEELYGDCEMHVIETKRPF